MKDKKSSLLREVGKLLTDPILSTSQKQCFKETASDSIGGNSSTFASKENLFGNNNLFENGNMWVSRTSLPIATYYASAFNLDDDLSIFSGGTIYEGASYDGPGSNDTYRFSDSSNIWSSRTDALARRYGSSSVHITTDYGLVSGGCNYGSHSPNSYRYTNSTNAWTTRTSINIGSLAFHISCYLRTGIKAIISDGLIATGEQLHTSEYIDSSNSWATKNDSGGYHMWSGFSISNIDSISLGIDVAERYMSSSGTWYYIASINESPSDDRVGMGSFGFDTGNGIIAGGSGISTPTNVLEKTEKYITANNIWVIRSNLLAVTSYSASFAVDGNGNGVVAGGNLGTYLVPEIISSVSKFYDGGFYLGSYFGTSYIYVSSDLINRGSDKYITSSTIFSREYKINNVLVSSSFSNDVSDTKYGISIDDGITWRDGFRVGSIADTIGLSPASDGIYKLKVRIGVKEDIRGDSWSYRADSPYAMSSGVGFTFTTDLALYNGGRNTSSSYHKESYSYQYSSNSWGTRSAAVKATYRQGGASFPNIGIMMGGYNGDDYLDLIQKYLHPADTWVSLSHTVEKRAEFVSASITYDISLYWGGKNSSSYLNSNAAYYNSSETVAFRTSMLSSRCEHCGGGLTSDIIMTATGTNSSANDINIVDRYSYSSNYWVARTYLSVNKDDCSAFSSPSDLFLVSTGHNSSSYDIYDTSLYSNSRNTWTCKSDIPENRQHTGDFNFTSSTGVFAGGIVSSSGYTSATLQYYLGNTNFYGFNVTDFCGERICQ